MSDAGQKLPRQPRNATSSLLRRTDIYRPAPLVRFVPETEVTCYSITSSASSKIDVACRSIARMMPTPIGNKQGQAALFVSSPEQTPHPHAKLAASMRVLRRPAKALRPASSRLRLIVCAPGHSS